jgi:Acetyltransferase (GNAT) domain
VGLIRLEPWGKADLALLRRLLADPVMMEHLGGPESQEKIAERQTRYEQPDSKQFKIVDEATGEGIGWVGYWERDWEGEQVYEIGAAGLSRAWSCGISVARGNCHGFLGAEPPVPSCLPVGRQRGIQRHLSQAWLHSARTVRDEYPKGRIMRCNDWRLDLLPYEAA